MECETHLATELKELRAIFLLAEDNLHDAELAFYLNLRTPFLELKLSLAYSVEFHEKTIHHLCLSQ